MSKSPVRWRSGEFTTAIDLCAVVTAARLEALGFRQRSSGGFGCRSYQSDGVDRAGLEFTLDQTLYQPPPPRPDRSATEEAAHEFQRPRGWRFRVSAPLRGLGDEAKIGRGVWGANWNHVVAVVVRVRNLTFQVRISAKGGERARGMVPSLADLEAGVLAVAGDALRRLGRPPAASPAAPAYGPGEVRQARATCATVAGGRRLLPGARSRDISRGAAVGGCLWERRHGDTTDRVIVQVEAVPPSPHSGEGAARIAEAATTSWSAGGRRLGGIGQTAISTRFDGDLLRSVDIQARQANLLVFVELYLWRADKGTGAMEKELAGLAKEVIAAHR